MKDYKKLQNGSDIRGIALSGGDGGEVNLTPQAVYDIAGAFGQWLIKRTGKAADQLTVCIGRDSRLSGEALTEEACRALCESGINAVLCGLASTPAMFMSCIFKETDADGSVMLTASHLPWDRNGMKFFTKDGGLEKEDIKAIVALANEFEPEKSAEQKKASSAELMELYSAHLRQVIADGLSADVDSEPLSGLSIVVDAGNGAGGFYANDVLLPLGADIFGSQFLEPDGHFPNHIPNPENSAAMDSVCSAVLSSRADLGIIFDTDVDRAAAVDPSGFPIARNAIVALSAALVSEDHPGSTVVTDSITSSELHDFLEGELGLSHLRYKRGYRNVINKGIELNNEGTECALAIETSGHAALKENYFLDDGAYLATKIIIKAAKLKKEGKNIGDCIAALKEPEEAIEVRIPIKAEDFAGYAAKVLDDLEASVKAGEFPGMSLELPNYEGVRVNTGGELGKGWFLIRKSLHEPLLPTNIESEKKGGTAKIKEILYGFLKNYKELELI